MIAYKDLNGTKLETIADKYNFLPLFLALTTVTITQSSYVTAVLVYLQGRVLLVCSKLYSFQNLGTVQFHWYGTAQ